MQLKNWLCLILCFVIFLPSCSDDSGVEMSTTAVTVTTTEPTTTEPSTTEPTTSFPDKLTYESTTIGDYGTVADSNNKKHKIFVNYEWVISKEFFECYYNPQNSEELYHKENRYGIADKDGNIIIEPQFGFIRPVAKDRFLVANGTKNDYSEFDASEYAVINSKGEIIIPFVPYIEWMVDYYDGLESNYFCVRIDSEKYYIADNNGNMVYDMYFTSFRVAQHDMYYMDKTHSGAFDGKMYYFDQELNIIKILDENPVAEELIYTDRDMEYYESVCYKNGSYYYGVINKTTGEEIVPCKYDEIIRFANDRILASSRNEEPVITSGGSTHYGKTIAIYDFYGNVLCPEGEYCNIEIYDAKYNSNYGERTYRNFEAVGVASAYNPNGDKIYGEMYEWLIDKNGTKISDKYYSISGQHWESDDERIYTADRGDRVFYLNKYGKVVGSI